MGIISEEIKKYDPYTDKSIKNTTTDRIEVGTDGNLYRLSISNGNEYLPKDKLYTNADMVDMLEELQAEIEKLPTNRMAITDSSGLICYGYSEYEPTAEDASKVIQQRINELKEDQEGKE